MSVEAAFCDRMLPERRVAMQVDLALVLGQNVWLRLLIVQFVLQVGLELLDTDLRSTHLYQTVGSLSHREPTFALVVDRERLSWNTEIDGLVWVALPQDRGDADLDGGTVNVVEDRLIRHDRLSMVQRRRWQGLCTDDRILEVGNAAQFLVHQEL
jgi:hypothetical protein